MCLMCLSIVKCICTSTRVVNFLQEALFQTRGCSWIPAAMSHLSKKDQILCICKAVYVLGSIMNNLYDLTALWHKCTSCVYMQELHSSKARFTWGYISKLALQKAPLNKQTLFLYILLYLDMLAGTCTCLCQANAIEKWIRCVI